MAPKSVSSPDRFQFLLEQFKLHTEQLRDFQSERYKITTWSIIAIVAYFGWVLTNPDEWCRVAIFSIVVAWLPFALALFGFVYVWKLHAIIDRHSAFLDHLENEMLSCGDKTEWAKFKGKGHEGKPLRRTLKVLWWSLLFGTFAFGVFLTSVSGLVCTPAETAALAQKSTDGRRSPIIYSSLRESASRFLR